MTTAEKLYQLIQTLPEEQINEVLQFAEFLQHKQHPSPSSKSIPPRTLTGLRGIAKRSSPTPSDDDLRTEAIEAMLGLLKTEQSAPTDQDVAAMLEEKKLEKYL